MSLAATAMPDSATVLTKSLRFMTCPRGAAGYAPHASILITADGSTTMFAKLAKISKTGASRMFFANLAIFAHLRDGVVFAIFRRPAKSTS
jgi:hypothetical protein